MCWVEQPDGSRPRAVHRVDVGRRLSRMFTRKADAKILLAAADADRPGPRVDPRGEALPFRDWRRPASPLARSPRPPAPGHPGRHQNHLKPAFGDLALLQTIETSRT